MGSKQSVLKRNSAKNSGKLKSKGTFKRYLRSSFLKALKVAPVKLIDGKKEEAGPSGRAKSSEEPKSPKTSETNNFESKKLNGPENILRIDAKEITDDIIKFLTPGDFGLFSPAFLSKKSSLENFESYWTDPSEESYSEDTEESIDESSESEDDFDYYENNQNYYYEPEENLNVAYVQGTVYRREIYGPPKEDKTEEVPIGREEYVITRRFEFGDKSKPTMPKKKTVQQKSSVSPGSSKDTRSTSTKRSSSSLRSSSSSSRKNASSSMSVASKRSRKKKVSAKRSVKGKPKKSAKPGSKKGSKKRALVVKKKGAKLKKTASKGKKKKSLKKNKSNSSLRSAKSEKAKTPNQQLDLETPFFCQPPFFPYFPDQRPCVCPQHQMSPYDAQQGRVMMGTSGKDVRIGVGQGSRPGYDIEFNDSGNMNLKIEQLLPGNNKTFIYRSGKAGSAESLNEPKSSKKVKIKKSKSNVSEDTDGKPKSALKAQKSQTSVKSKKKKMSKKKSKTKLGAKAKKTPSKIEKGKTKPTKPESVKPVKKGTPKTSKSKTPWEKKARHLKKQIVERCQLDETELRNAFLKPENKDLLKKLCQGFDDKVDKIDEKADSKQSDLKAIDSKQADANVLIKRDSKTGIPNMNIVINVPPCAGKMDALYEKRGTLDSVKSGGSKEIYLDVGLKNMGPEYMENVARKASVSYNHPDAKIKVSTPSVAISRRTLPSTTIRNSEAIQTDIAMMDIKENADNILKNSVDDDPKRSLEEGAKDGIKSAIKSPVGSAGNVSMYSIVSLKDGKKQEEDKDDSKKRKVKLTDQEADLKNHSRVNFDEVDLKEESKQLLDIKENLAFLRKELEKETSKDKKSKGTNRVIAIYTRRKLSGQDSFEECLNACEDGTIEIGERRGDRPRSRKHRRKTSFDEGQTDRDKKQSFKSDLIPPKTRFDTKNEEFSDSEEEATSEEYFEKLKEQLRSELEASQSEKNDPASTSKHFQIQEEEMSPEDKRKKHKEMLEEQMKKGGFYHPGSKKQSSASDIREDLKSESLTNKKEARTSNIKPADVTQLFLKSLEELQEAWHHPDNVSSNYNISNADDENLAVHKRDPSIAARNQKRRMYQRKLASRASIWQHPESSIVEESPISSVDSEEQLIIKQTGRNSRKSGFSTGTVTPNSRHSREDRQRALSRRSTGASSGKRIQDDRDSFGEKPRDRGSSGGSGGKTPRERTSSGGTQRKVQDNQTTIGQRNPDEIEDLNQQPRDRGSPGATGGQMSPKDRQSLREGQRRAQDKLSNDTTIGQRNQSAKEDLSQKPERGSFEGTDGQKIIPVGAQRKRQELSNITTIGQKNPKDNTNEQGKTSADKNVSQSSKTPIKDSTRSSNKEQDEIEMADSSREYSGQEITSPERRQTVFPMQTSLAEGLRHDPKEALEQDSSRYEGSFHPTNASGIRANALKTHVPESILQKRQNTGAGKQDSYQQRHTRFMNGQGSINSRKGNLNDLIRSTGKVQLKELNEGTLKVDVSKLNSNAFEGQVPDDGKPQNRSSRST